MNQKSAPIYEALEHFRKKRVVPFDGPGHKRGRGNPELVELLEAEGLRDRFILVCGGARITHELAKELGYDAGFGQQKYAEDVATFAITEMVKRGKK